jgi:hypothetical protein
MSSKKSFRVGQTMEISIPLLNEFSLKIGDASSNSGKYPTGTLQKGLRLYHKTLELTEEGVGFGVPVIKKGIKTLFPGEIELSSQQNYANWKITAKYKLNLEEKVGKKGKNTITSNSLYIIQNFLAALYRTIPLARKLLTFFSNNIRRMFQWETRFCKIENNFEIIITYTIQPSTGSIKVVVETESINKANLTEIILMNEQGAHYFDRYTDSSGECLEGEDISAWHEISARRATFISREIKIAFSLSQIEGARFFRGRELVESRLSWSGFGYSIPLNEDPFCYEIKIEAQS